LPIVREYLEGFALIHYAKSSRGSALTSLVAFCEFLLEVGVSSMNDVVPKVITDYLVWGTKQGRNQVAHSVSPLSTFFNWQIAEGRRILPNPIVPSIHKTRRNECEPRPFSSEEIDFAWELLQKQGDARIRLAMAIGLESGLRIGEIANIRLQDVDRVKQRIYVRTPTKTRKTRQTPFGEKTSALLDEWMAERDPNCGHDHLLCNKHGGPATAQSLRFGFTSALTKLGSNYYSGGPEQNDDGFDEWHTHRLRHTMSSNLANGGADVSTVMAIGGWSTFKAMSGYTKIDDSVAQSGYEAAMKKAKEQLAETKPNLRINLSDLAKKKQTSGNP
jgi:integrase